jgi:hypothetical protein
VAKTEQKEVKVINYASFTSMQFANLFIEKLSEHYQSAGPQNQSLFYFEGQSPFSYHLPSEALAELYWSLAPAVRPKMVDGLFDAMGSRLEMVPTAALTNLVAAVGLIHRQELIAPMIHLIGQRASDTPDIRPVYHMAIMVLNGFEFLSFVLEAAKDLIGFKSFPNDLVYDVFELLLHDPNRRWSQHFLELLPRLNHDASLANLETRVVPRLQDTAREIAERVSVGEVGKGLQELLEIDWNDLDARPLAERHDPIGLLAARLFVDDDAPFHLSLTGHLKALRLVSRDGLRSWVVPKSSVLHNFVPWRTDVAKPVHDFLIAA